MRRRRHRLVGLLCLVGACVGEEAARLLVSLEDGVILTLDAATGAEVGRFASGGPLTKGTANLFPNPEDGTIYVVEDGVAKPFVDAFEFAERDVPLMQCLSEAIADRNVFLDEDDDREERLFDTRCGLLYGERLRKLIAVDVNSGSLLWQHDSGASTTSVARTTRALSTAKQRPALLQRDEYVVRLLDASDGLERWNVTLSTITAFGPSNDQDDDGGLAEKHRGAAEDRGRAEDRPPSDTRPRPGGPRVPKLEWRRPAELRAVDAEDSSPIWSISLPCAPTDLFAATRDGVWTKVVVDVLDNPAAAAHGALDRARPDVLLDRDSTPLLPAPRAPEEDEDREPPRGRRAAREEEKDQSHPRSLKLELSPQVVIQLILALVLIVVSTVWVVLRHDRRRRRSLPASPSGVNSSALQQTQEDTSVVAEPIPGARSLGSMMLDRLVRPSPETTTTTTTPSLVSANRYDAEFEQKERLGDGGFGTVHRAVNRLDAKEYAIKKIQIRSEKLRDKILREVKILAALDHPNIVRYYQAWLEKTDQATADAKDGDHTSSYLFEGESDHHDDDECLEWTDEENDTPKNRVVDDDDDDDDDLSEDDDDAENAENDDDDDDDPEWNALPSAPASQDLVRAESSSKSLSKRRRRSQKSHRRHANRDPSSSRESGFVKADPSTLTSGGGGGGEGRRRRRRKHKCPDTDSSAVFETAERLNTEEDDAPPRHHPQPPKQECLLLYIQMQLCSAQTLREHLDRRESGQPLLADAALQIFAQACRGLRYVHARDLIHRDLKPANIFLNQDGTVKIGDFGLSRVAKHHFKDDDDDDDDLEGAPHGGGDDDEEKDYLDDDDDDDEETTTNSVLNNVGDDVTAGVGTRLYAAPEQLTSEDYDEKVDVFSLGVVLFEMLRPKFDTAMERYLVLGSLPDTKPETLRLQARDASVAALVSDMVKKDPSRRPSASAANDAVDTILDRGLVQSLHLQNPQLTKVVLRSADGDLRIYNSDGVVLSSERSGDSSNASPGPNDFSSSASSSQQTTTKGVVPSSW